MSANDDKKNNIKKSVKAGIIDFFSIIHLIILLAGTAFYQIIFNPDQSGWEYLFVWVVGFPLLCLAGLMAFIILIQKEKNLFNKITSLFTLSAIGLLVISGIIYHVIYLFIE